ncbi:MAG: ABC transporter permease [Candidatus Acidiferrales bacterium]
MSVLQKIAGGIRALFQKERDVRELDEELSGYLEAAAAEKMKSGMGRQEALRAARLEMGSHDGVKEQVLAAGWETHVETLWQDIRFGLRMVRKSPGFTAIAVVTLALAIGANAAIFSVIDAALLKPLPFAEANRIVSVYGRWPDFDRNPVSFADFEDWKAHNSVFSEMAASFPANLNFVGSQEPERLNGLMVTEGFFDVLGTRAALGRTFLQEEHREGSSPVCIVGYGFWQREFGGDPRVVGRAIEMNGTAFVVVGVMPAAAPNFFARPQTDVWVPLEPRAPWRQQGTNYLQVYARLRPGLTISQAAQNLEVVQDGINAQFPDNKHDTNVIGLQESLFGDQRPVLLALLAAVGLVLLIACTNLASLLLGRLTRRSREFAIRTAMGSSRWRLVRQMIVETSLLALIGGGLGALIAMWGTRVILLHWPPRTLRPDAGGLDSHVLLFILGVTILAVLLYGLAPAIRATHWNASEILKEAATQSTDSVATGRMHTFFVVAQTALATILLINSGLMLKSLRTLLSVDPGFGAERVLAMNISLPIRQYPTESKWQIFYTQFLERIRALPGVRDAGMVLNLPVGGGNSSGDFLIEGRPKFSAGQVNVQKQIASPGYFEAMGIRLVRGRFFSERDAADAPPVVLISESMARHFWPNEDPVGKRMDLQYGSVKGWQEIAGVVGDVKSDGLEFASPDTAYLCSLQNPSPAMSLVIRAEGSPASLTPAIKNELRMLDSRLPLYGITTMTEVVSDSEAGRRMSASLVGIFAALSVLLAAMGVYGVLSYSFAQRTHEIGLRMAFGAQKKDILRLVLGKGTRWTALGLGIGLVGAAVTAKLLTNLLFGVRPIDLGTYAASAILLALVALAACYIPARRAMRVDPMVALRYE